jgi:methyl-accepting chemotaxis protein
MVFLFIIVILILYTSGAVDVFEMLNFTSWQTAISVIVLFVVAVAIGIIPYIKISAYFISKGVGEYFLTIGLIAFLVARLVGVAAAFEPTITNLQHHVQEQGKNQTQFRQNLDEMSTAITNLQRDAQEQGKNQMQFRQNLDEMSTAITNLQRDVQRQGKNQTQFRQNLDEMRKELLRITDRVKP